MTDARSMLWLMRAQEAIASVSLSHPEDCECTTCRAAAGDPDALAEVLMVVNEEMPDARG